VLRKNVGASRKNVKQVVALRARTSNQWGASRKNVKQVLALRAKMSIIGASRKIVGKITH